MLAYNNHDIIFLTNVHVMTIQYNIFIKSPLHVHGSSDLIYKLGKGKKKKEKKEKRKRNIILQN